MTRHTHSRHVLLVAAVAVALGTAGRADDDDAIPFDEAQLFLEFNSTDDDLGVQLFLDGEAWKKLLVFDPNGHKILEIGAKGILKELGLTELRWESAEPSPEEVLDLLPEGDYGFEGMTVEGDEMEGTATLSHDLLDPPVFEVGPTTGGMVDPDNAIIEWEAIDGAEGWEVIVENEDLGVMMTVILPADVMSLQIPPTFLEPDTEYKAEVLAIGENGNKTITESTFVTEP